MKRVWWFIIIVFATGCATLPPSRGDPPLPFARVQDIPWAGAAVYPAGCGGEIGLSIVTTTAPPYQILLHPSRAILADNRPGDELPVWFVEVQEDRTFRLAFVLPFGEALRRYPDPCAWLVPGTPSPKPSNHLILQRRTGNGGKRPGSSGIPGTCLTPSPARMPRTMSGGASCFAPSVGES